MVTETVGQRIRRLREALPTGDEKRTLDWRGMNLWRETQGMPPLPQPCMSQRELAVPGVSYAYISRIERGERTPSVKALRLIAPRLGVEVSYLETGEDLIDVRLPRTVALSLLTRFSTAQEESESYATDEVYNVLVEELRRHVRVEEVAATEGWPILELATTSC